MISLAGQTALVTGGSRGIGRATALLLARAGADVALTFHTRGRGGRGRGGGDPERGPAGVRRSAAIWPIPKSPTGMCGAVRREFGGLDSFVANAGVWPPDEVPLRDLAPPAGGRRWRPTWTPSSSPPGRRSALMRPGGRVVIVSSTAGQRGEAYHTRLCGHQGCADRAHQVTRHRVRAPTSGELRGAGLGGHRHVHARPSRATDAGANASQPSRCAGSRRREDIAGPILFLCSDLARHITGEVLNVNGGSVLCG